ncbi:hypothetical protein PF010_g32509 [Phytophthora fragariae]|uniref:Uncharacterized protein n=1 Tax=Phytophthora fragariae TaxID=53985 RepID=A0A6G0JEE2_9STRA|nr:hypothetical protein PF010_g32509 [Phytophthora fragariae]
MGHAEGGRRQRLFAMQAKLPSPTNSNVSSKPTSPPTSTQPCTKGYAGPDRGYHCATGGSIADSNGTTDAGTALTKPACRVGSCSCIIHNTASLPRAYVA